MGSGVIMITYTYYCAKCDVEFIVKKRITDQMLQNCKECGNPAERIIDNGNFLLRGEGWYKTGHND